MVTLTLDGTSREIRFDHVALPLAESYMTRSVLEVVGRHGGLFKLDELATLLWAAWAKDNPRLTVRSVLGWISQALASGGSLMEMNGAILDALSESGYLGTPRADADARPTTAAAAS